MAISMSARLNDLALRGFRDVADGDYVAARMAFRAMLFQQFLWSSQQALEKYLKCILLMNRIPAPNVLHNLERALLKIREEAPFSLQLSDSTREFIEYVDSVGQYRYYESSYFVSGQHLLHLDRAVWEIRRYCTRLDHVVTTSDGEKRSLLDLELRRIEAADPERPHAYRWFPRGHLEQIMGKRDHPAREPLLWQNAYFASRRRTTVLLWSGFQAGNSPFSLDPELIAEAKKYIKIPQYIQRAYREMHQRRASKRTTS